MPIFVFQISVANWLDMTVSLRFGLIVSRTGLKWSEMSPSSKSLLVSRIYYSPTQLVANKYWQPMRVFSSRHRLIYNSVMIIW
jgi:hypothetical protein